MFYICLAADNYFLNPKIWWNAGIYLMIVLKLERKRNKPLLKNVEMKLEVV